MSAVSSDPPRPGEPRVARIVRRVEEVLFSAFLVALLAGGLMTVFARWFGWRGITWSGQLSQQIVLWLAMLGAFAATGDRKHISIDIVSQFLPARAKVFFGLLVQLVAALICALLVAPSWTFAVEELKAEGAKVAFLGLRTGWLPLVLPVGFALLSLRFLIEAWVDGRATLQAMRRPPTGAP